MERAVERSRGIFSSGALYRRSLPFRGFLATVLLAGSPALAVDEEYPAITSAQVRGGQFRPGEKRSVTGKYQELVNRELKLIDTEVRFVLGQPQLMRQVLLCKAQKDNLTLFGFFQDPAKDGGSQPIDGLPVFEVEKIILAPGDGELYARKLRDLLESSQASAEALKELALEAASVLKRFGDPDLLPVARRVVTAAFSKGEAALPAKDAEGRLALIRQFHEALGDVALVLDLLRAQARRYPRHAPTAAFLRQLSCHQVGGEWLTHEEFKQKLGFVLHRDRWVKPERKEFLEIVQKVLAENKTNLILRSRTDQEYTFLSQEGKVEKGMTREELAATAGLPDRVLREVDGGQEIDQWNYGDHRIYLLNGQVVDKAP